MRKRALAMSAPPVLLGLAGSLAVALAAPRLAGGQVRWWFDPRLPAQHAVLYAGMAGLALAWAWLGVSAWQRGLTAVRLGLIAAAWALPLVLTAPVFSLDVYSYLAQGTLAHLGHSPYSAIPSALAGLGHADALAAVSPFWRHTTAPYGPLFLGVVGLIAGVSAHNLVLGAALIKLLGAVGLVLVCLVLPRLARRVGADPARATWLVAGNPLVLLALVAPGHNDLLMVGVMLTGVWLALSDRPLAGIAVCALAAAIKLPALAAALFTAVLWARSDAARWDLRRLAAAGTAVVAVLALVSLVTGFGTDWVSGSVVSTPGRVHLAITPATALGWSLASLLRAGGLHVGAHAAQSGFAALALALAACLAFDQLRRLERDELPRRLGLTLVAFAVCGPAAWPWYLIWGLALLAVGAGARTWKVIAAASVAGTFVVKPDGILALSVRAAPLVLCVYVACGALAWYLWRREPAGARLAARPELAGLP